MSKSLEALKRIKHNVAEIVSDDYHWEDYENDIDLIEEELKECEKAQFKLKALGNFVLKSKALEIIIEKLVNIYWVYIVSNVNAYNRYVKDYFCKPYFEEFLLTEEEFKLVKEIITWKN